jgi:hypothetical protein
VSRLDGGMKFRWRMLVFDVNAILCSLALEIKVVEFKVSRVHTVR